MSVVYTTDTMTFAIQPCLRARALLRRMQHSGATLHQYARLLQRRPCAGASLSARPGYCSACTPQGPACGCVPNPLLYAMGKHSTCGALVQTVKGRHCARKPGLALQATVTAFLHQKQCLKRGAHLSLRVGNLGREHSGSTTAM